MFSMKRREQFQFTSRVQKCMSVLRLLWGADEFLSLFLYRVRTALHDLGVPLLPRLLYYANSFLYGVRIGDHVIIEPGLYLPHGQVVIDGITRIGHQCMIAPWSTIGLVAGNAMGPNIGNGVIVGTGARMLGELTIGDNARIGANAVILEDIPAGATAIGVPARIVESDVGAET